MANGLMIDIESLIDPEKMAELRRLLSHFCETRPSHHLYLLLDNACPVDPGHPMHPAMLAQRPVTRQMSSFAGPTDAGQWQPLLLKLYAAGENGFVDDELVALSLATACDGQADINGAYMAAWIGSELDGDALARRLAQRCQQFDMLQGKRRKIALYEPHRMALLLDTPSHAEFLQGFLSEIALWAFIDNAGTLRSTVVDAALRPPTAPVRMSLQLCAAQARVPLAKRALLGVVKAGVDIPEKIETRLDELLVCADRAGLQELEDLIFFVLNALTLSPQWHLHPEASRCIARSREGESLPGLMAELPDATLNEIGHYRAS